MWDWLTLGLDESRFIRESGSSETIDLVTLSGDAGALKDPLQG